MHSPLTWLQRSRSAAVVWLLACAVLQASPVWAQQVKGKVRGGVAPLEGAGISVELDGRARNAPNAGADGAFALDLQQLFQRNVAGTADLLLRVSAPGFVPSSRSMRVDQATKFPLVITLSPESGGGALSAEDQQKLAPFVNPGGSGALMLVPYDLPEDLATPKLAERLRFNIERLIITYVQATLGPDSPPLAVRLMPLDGAHDQDRLRAVGRHVNALAVVSGNGERITPSELAVSSSYVIPPQSGPVKPLSAFVDDRIPASQLASPELHRQLNRLWGRVTLLAMAVRDINAAPPSGAARVDALKRVRTYLVAERANTGPRNSEFTVEIDALLAMIAREVKP